MATKPPDPLSLPWRVGRHVPRHIYVQLGAGPDDEDRYIGTLETPELAAEACTGHNARLSPNPAVALANAAIREAFARE